MFLNSFVNCVASILLLQLCAANGVDERIVGGATTRISTTPYLVKIRLNNKFICGGSLPSPRYVISAAHCFQGVSPKQLAVIGGATKLTEPGVKRKVVKIMMPKNFDMSTMNNDVAVLKLAEPMTGKNIRVIDLYAGNLNPGMLVRVSGWGLTRENGRSPSNLLRTVVVPVISKPKCEVQYRGVKRLTNTMFCASKPGIKDACSGDSGGPVVYRGKLCGIVSWGVGCARSNFPGVYTNIQFVRAFIRNSMEQ